MNIPNYLNKVREVNLTKEHLLSFEEEVKNSYDDAKIVAPVHLSKIMKNN